MTPENKLILGTLLGVIGFYAVLGRFQNASYSNQVGEHPGDGISTFSEDGDIRVSSNIDANFLPEEFRMNSQEQESCEYLNTTLHNLEVDANFADNQEELDDLMSDIDLIFEMKDSIGCL